MEIFGIYFSRPDMIYSFVFVIVVFFLLLRSRQQRRKALKTLGVDKNFNVAKLRSLKNILLLIGFCFLSLSLLTPQWGQKKVTIKAQGLDLCFALDVSPSMLAEDVSPNRLEQAKQQLSIFLPKLGGDRASLVAFAGSAYLASPLSIDHNTLSNFLRPINPDFISDRGTNLNQALSTCFRALELDDAKDRIDLLTRSAKLIVIISDGENTSEDGLSELNKAKKLGVPIYAMAMGTTKGSPIPVKDRYGNLRTYIKDPASGQPFISKLIDKDLKKLAAESGGKIFYTRQGISVWQDFRSAISNYKRESRDSGTKFAKEHRFQWPLFIGILLLLIEFFLAETAILPLFPLLLFFFLGPKSTFAKDQSSLNNIYQNKQALKMFKNKNFNLAQPHFDKSLEENPSSFINRFNWASNKLFSAVKKNDENAKEPVSIDKNKVDQALKEFQKMSEDYNGRIADNANKILHYQKSQALELKGDLAAALESYYQALILEPGDHELNPKIKTNISRLLTALQQQKQQSDGQGEGKGDKENKEDKGQGKKQKKNPKEGDDTPKQKQKPKYKGTELDNKQVEQILQSVAGEENDVQKRKAQEKSRKSGEDPNKAASQRNNQRPW